ncbi:hypothetical protein ABPG74_004017 [Tetrahymena malaccensis]
MSTNQKKIIKDKKTIIKPKDKKKTKQVQMNDFIKANKFYSEEFSNMSLPSQFDKVGNQDSNKFSVMDEEEEEEAKQESNVEVAELQGYSNIKLNPSPNSGLEPNLEVNQNTIQYWYYTLGKSFREYQYSIVKTCLSNNTLVALPTGLGKTFIAATVILNYYLWFPKGKIFFLAPTRPLVNQQMECLNHFELINKNDIFEMTGNYPIPKRKDVYLRKRIFFCTPQTLENDLVEQRYDGYNLSLVIFDEAHRGTGKYAYVNIVSHFESLGYGYRILALSATPGNEFEQIQVKYFFIQNFQNSKNNLFNLLFILKQEVLKNLRISKLEIKDEEDPDIKQYIHSKQIIPVKIQGNDLMTKIMSYVDNLLYSRFNYFKNLQMIPIQLYKLVKKPSDIQRGTSFHIMEFIKQNQDDIIEKHHTVGLGDAYDQLQTFSQLIHGKKLIQEQGINCFKDWLHQFETDVNNKKGKPLRSKLQIFKLQDFIDLKKVMKMDSYVPKQKKPKKKKSASNQQKQLNYDNDDGYEDDNAPLKQNNKNSKGSSENFDDFELAEDLESHPKSEKLVELLTNYFLEDESIANRSKTIIFTQSRNSASELKKLLNNIDVANPAGEKLIRSEIFIGQANTDGQGMNQKAQIETINLFKQNVYNTLIATCIGEEGLDIGEVDLIVCYDSGFSPIRMIQRMGRTGRKRAGKVYVLLMEGREYANYNQSQKKHKELMMLLKNNSCSQSVIDFQQKGRSGRQPKAAKRSFEFYGFNPRMIPQDVNPICRIIKSKNNDFTPVLSNQSESEEDDYFEFQGSKQNKEKQSNQFQKKKQIIQLQVEEEEVEEEEQQFKLEIKKDLEDIYCYEIEEIDFEPPQQIMKPTFEKPKKSLEKTQKQQEVQDRLLQLANNINGKRQQPAVKQPQLPQQNQQKVMNTPETMTPFSNFSSNEKFMRNSSNGNKKQTSVFDTNVKRSSTTNQIRKSDPKQVTKIPLKSNSKKNRLIISDSENMENDEFNSDLYSNYNHQCSRQLDFNSNNPVSNLERTNFHSSFEKPIDDEIVFLKKVNPLHVFGNIEQEKMSVMKKRSNSKSSSDFNLNDYSLLYQNEEQSNQSELDSLIKQIEQNTPQKAQNSKQNQIQKFNFNQFEQDDDDDDDDEDDKQIIEMLKNSKSLSQNINNQIQEQKQEKVSNMIYKSFAEDNLFAANIKQQQPQQNKFQQNQQGQAQKLPISNQPQNIQKFQQQNNFNANIKNVNNNNNYMSSNLNLQIENNPQQNTLNACKENQQYLSTNYVFQQKGLATQNQQTNIESQKFTFPKNHLSAAINISKMIDEIDNDEDDEDDDDDIDFLKRIASTKSSVQQSASNNQFTNPSNSIKAIEKMEIESFQNSKPASLQTNKSGQKNQLQIQNNQILDSKQTQINNTLSKLQDDDTDSDSDEDNVEDLKKLMSLKIFNSNQNIQTNNNQVSKKVELDSVSYSSLNILNTQNNTKTPNNQANGQISTSLIEKIPEANNFKNNFFNNQKDSNINNNQIKQNLNQNNQKQIESLQNNVNREQNGISNINNNKKLIPPQISYNPQIEQINQQNNANTKEQNKNNNSNICNNQNNILKNFSGIKNVIQDKTKQVIQVNNQNIIVSNIQSQSKQNNEINSIQNTINNQNKNEQNNISLYNKNQSQQPLKQQIFGNENQINNNIKNELKRSESDSQSKLQQENQKEMQTLRKTACDLHLEQIRKKMQEDFDIEEFNQRNKNKVVGQPKLDPKKARKAKKENQNKQDSNTAAKQNIEQISQDFKSVQQMAEEIRLKNLQEQNNQISKTNDENDTAQNKNSQSLINPLINKENDIIQPNQDKVKQDHLLPFQDLFSCILDCDEDYKDAAKQCSKTENLQDEQINSNQSKKKRENPFLDNPNSTYNSVQIDKKQFPKQ